MRRFTHLLALSSLMISACQGSLPVVRQTGTTAFKPNASSAPVTILGTPSPRTSASASTSPIASTAPSPSGPTSALAGSIMLDPAYVVAAGGGQVIAAGGANVIAAGGANVIAAGGANVIAAGGANVIAAGGGNLIQVGSAGVIAAGGANVIAAGGANYHVADLPVSGTLLPVAGMVVAPVSLQTHKLLAPAVYTDATGHYQFNIPASETANCEIVAGVPGKSASDPVVNDPRLQFVHLVNPAAAQAAPPVLNDDTANCCEFTRKAFVAYFEPLLFSMDETQTTVLFQAWQVPDAFKDNFYHNTISPLQKLVAQAGLSSLSDGQRLLLTQRIIDMALARTDLRTVPLQLQVFGWSGPTPTEPDAMSLTQDVLSRIRQRADMKAAQPGFFTGLPYLQGSPIAVANGNDLIRFIVETYFEKDVPAPITQAGVAMDSVSARWIDPANLGQVYTAQPSDNAAIMDQVRALNVAALSLIYAMFTTMTQPDYDAALATLLSSASATLNDPNQVAL